MDRSRRNIERRPPSHYALAWPLPTNFGFIKTGFERFQLRNLAAVIVASLARPHSQAEARTPLRAQGLWMPVAALGQDVYHFHPTAVHESEKVTETARPARVRPSPGCRA